MVAGEATTVGSRGVSQELSSSTLDQRARRIVAWVAALNLIGFFGEFIIASIIGSASLFADAADFLEDFLINALVLAALHWSATGRRKASYGLAGLILIPALASFGMAIWKIINGAVPEPLALSGTAVVAMIINFVCAVHSHAARGWPHAMTSLRTYSSLQQAFS